MFTAKEGQCRILERLDTKRHTVDAGCLEPPENGGLGRCRIGFGGDFNVGAKPNSRSAVSRMSATSSGDIRLGVPPPRKIDTRLRPRP